MSEIEKKAAIELTAEEMDRIVGGAYKPLPPKEGFIVYQIKRGDTLGKIAMKFKCTVGDILVWNPKVSDINLIYAGDYLYIKE